MKTYYDILGVAKEATQKEIKSAYRKLVKKFHPDVSKKSGAQPKVFEEITTAYNTLSHADKRKEYNQSLLAKKIINPLNLFKFRELKNWVFSLQFIKLLLSGKKVAKQKQHVDPSILELSVDELLKRVMYSNNVHVQVHAVRAIFAKKKHYAVNDLLRLLYSGINETVKIEILNGLKLRHESKIQKVVREIYDIEKSLRVKQLIRSFVRL